MIKLFFFADYEGNRQVQAITRQRRFRPTCSVREFSRPLLAHLCRCAIPVTGTVYANGIVPQADWTPLATLVIAALPSPNVQALQTTTRRFPAPHLTDNKGDGRIDYILSTKTALFGRYSDHKGDIVDATSIPGDAGDGGNGTIHAYNRQIAAGITHTSTQILL